MKLWEWMSSPRERQEKMRKVPKNSNMKRSQQRRQKQKQRGKRGDCNVPEAKEGESFREEGVLSAAEISNTVLAEDCPLDLQQGGY